MWYKIAKKTLTSRSLIWHSCARPANLSLFFLKQLYFILPPPLAAPRLPSPFSRQRADAGKHFLSPRSYFLSLGIHFLFVANTTALRAFLRSLPITNTHTHTENISMHWLTVLAARDVCVLFSLDSGSLACRQSLSCNFSRFVLQAIHL